MSAGATPAPVSWIPAARQDLRELTRWWRQDVPTGARTQLRRVRRAANSLAASPHRGHRVPELGGTGIQNVRELSVTPYRLIYEVSERHGVVVVGVFDARRDLGPALMDRLMGG